MTAGERRNAILHVLEGADHPVSAFALAVKFGVSRQSIVGDVALLRAGGVDIAAAARGYILPRKIGRMALSGALRAGTLLGIWNGNCRLSSITGVPCWM